MHLKKRFVALLGGLIVVVVIYLLTRPYYIFMTRVLGISPFKAMVSRDGLVTIDNKVNVLLLGIPGGLHDGPNLSDSITILSYDVVENRLASIGLPRDIWSDTLKDKINSAYAYGEAASPGAGIKLAKAEVSSVIGLPVHYGVVINFSQFKELIDFMGGVDVEVERSFVDNEFPIAGRENDECDGDLAYKCRYKTVTFTKGKTHMDGETALNYVRSRHAKGDEGTDFARTKRQQRVMEALRRVGLGVVASGDIRKMTQLYELINRLIMRDITNQQSAIIARHILLGKDFSQESSATPEEMFEVPPVYEYGKYVLVPRDSSWQEIHTYVKQFFHIQYISKNYEAK